MKPFGARSKIFFFFTILISFHIQSFALEINRKITQFKLDSWGSEQDLEQNSVFSINFLKNGYLWIGTNEGLRGFDGNRFFPIANESSRNAIGARAVRAICQDRKGYVWIGTNDGLYCLQGKRTLRFTAQEGLFCPSIDFICETRDGVIWVGSEKGIAQVRNERVFRDERLTDFPLCRVRCILEDHSGCIWIGTDGEGLFRFQGGKLASLKAKDGLSSDYVYSLMEDKNGCLWAGTKNRLNRIDKGNITSYVVDGEYPEAIHIMSLYQDHSGNFWLGTEKGLYRFQEGRFERFSKKEGFPGDLLRCLSEDPEGSMWIGTIDAGLVRLRDTKISVISKETGLADDRTTSVAKDIHGRVWIGTQNGLTLMEPLQNIQLKKENGLSDDLITCLNQDRKGAMHVGTKLGLDTATDGRISHNKTLAGKYIFSILNDSKMNMWVGTLEGLYFIHGEKKELLTVKDGLSSNLIKILLEDPSGRVWIGTGKGVNTILYDDGARNPLGIARLDKTSTLNINALFRCTHGLIWIGSTEGLKLLHNERLHSFSTNDGTFNYSVETICEDEANNLWLGTKGGIIQVPKDELLRFAETGNSPIHPVLYTERDGMHSRLCNGPGAVTGKGDQLRLWFPTIMGVAVIEPNRITTNKVQPPVYIEEMTVDGDNKPLLAGDRRQPEVLAPGTKRIEFRFTALSFLQPEKVRFRFRLDGYDKEWMESDSSRRFATYTNIPPGHYTFRVIACNNDGVWNNQGDSVSLYLEPYFFQRPIFYFALSLLTLLVVFGFISYRTRRLEARKRELEKRIKEKTGELAEANRELQNLNRRVFQANTELEAINRQLRAEIGEKERAQEALRESNVKLKELDRLKTEFLNMVSHELRTPLTSVVGFAKMIRKKQEEVLFPVIHGHDRRIERSKSLVKKDIDIIISEGERLTAMINDLLDIAKLESGKTIWSMEKLQIRDIIHNAVAFTASLFEPKQLQRRIEIEENLPLVIGDRDRLIQVLINLLSNAVKFTEKGTVTCRARLAKEEGGKAGAPFIEVCVIDTGIGVASEHHDKLFDKFIQVREGKNTLMKGTGLGLSICKQIIEHHGGRIWVKSTEGLGSAFFFTLPTAK